MAFEKTVSRKINLTKIADSEYKDLAGSGKNKDTSNEEKIIPVKKIESCPDGKCDCNR